MRIHPVSVYVYFSRDSTERDRVLRAAEDRPTSGTVPRACPGDSLSCKVQPLHTGIIISILI